MSRLSVWSLMASKMESGDTRLVGLTTFSRSFMLISGNLMHSRIGLGSCPWLCSVHLTTALNIVFSGAQNESLDINSLIELWKKTKWIVTLMSDFLEFYYLYIIRYWYTFTWNFLICTFNFSLSQFFLNMYKLRLKTSDVKKYLKETHLR